MSRFCFCNCPAGFSAAPERHAPDCPGRFGAGKTRTPVQAATPVAKVPADQELEAVLHWRGKHAQAIRERNALQLLLNERDEQLTSLEQRRYAEQQAREAAECNAARYRWLRGRNLETIHQGGVFAGKTPENMVINGVDLDNAIDAAIEAALNLASEAESQSPAPGYAPSPQQ